jgi:DNA-binding response OmpR family regulator
MVNNVNNKVLLLEDEPVIGRVLDRVLGADGFKVDIALNGLVAKEKINSENNYDILIFDIRTPVINGIQLYEYLEKERPELTGKVIFTTGDCLNVKTKAFLDRVNRPYLAKPYSPTQIKSFIKDNFN